VLHHVNQIDLFEDGSVMFVRNVHADIAEHGVIACHEYCDKKSAAMEINILCGENCCVH
jgi:hypothetical protein